jgi:enamine deaminase RidA (YjgF/YER057c/UK114 family)
MGERMPAPSGSAPVAGGPTSRLRELGIVLPVPPTPLGAYVESSDAGYLLFLSGMLPVVNRGAGVVAFPLGAQPCTGNASPNIGLPLLDCS